SWLRLDTSGQLSSESTTPSLSVSSQASPMPLLLPSAWAGLDTAGQLSTTSRMPSPSVSVVPPPFCGGLVGPAPSEPEPLALQPASARPPSDSRAINRTRGYDMTTP